MVFSIRNILTGLATGLIAARGVRADDCDEISGPFAAVGHFGERNIQPYTGFCHTKWTQGLVVTGIEVWGTNYHINGVQLSYSDGTTGPMLGSNAFGDNKGQDNGQGGDRYHSQLRWGDKDPVTKFLAATSKDGHALGLIHIEVGGKTLTVGEKDVGDGTPVDLGSGIMVGASGQTSSFIRFFTPLFLGTTEGTAQITDLVFDQDLATLNKMTNDKKGIDSVSLASITIKNSNEPPTNKSDTSRNQAWSFGGSDTKTVSSSITTTNTNTFGLSIALTVSAEVEVPMVAKISASTTTTASYSYSNAVSKDTTTSDAQAFTWSQGSTPSTDLLQPGRAKACTATVMKGHYSGGYTAKVALKIRGKAFTFNQRGTFDSISYSNVLQECKDIAIKDIPAGANVTEAKDTVSDKGKRAAFFGVDLF